MDNTYKSAEDKTETKRLPLGRGRLSAEGYCVAADDRLLQFLGCNVRRLFTELAAGEDRLTLIEGLEAAKEEPQTIFLSMERFPETQRKVLLRIQWNRDGETARQGSFDIELTDVEDSAVSYASVAEEREIFSRYLERISGYLFEYNLKEEKLSVFRYVQGERLAVDEPIYTEILLSLMKRVQTLKGNTEQLRDTIEKDGRIFYIDGVTILRDFEVYRVIGQIRERVERQNEGITKPEPTGPHGNELDSFTGLYSKVSALNFAKERIESPDSRQVVLIMIDLDHFKEINDTYGHIFGDEVLRKMAMILKEACHGRGIASRFGGDEFLLVLENVGSEGEIRSIIESIRVRMRWAFADSQRKMEITCTVGMAEYPKNGSNFDIVFKKADRALYIGKEKGRNRYIIYKEYLHGELTEQDDINLEQGIREALNMGQFIRNVSWCMSTLYQSGSANLNVVMERLLGIYHIDSIGIYLGQNMERTYSFGQNPEPAEALEEINEPEAQRLFNDEGCCHLSFVQKNPDISGAFYEKLKKNGLFDITLILIGTRDKFRGVVSFERRRRDEATSKKWSSEELHILILCTQIIGSIVS